MIPLTVDGDDNDEGDADGDGDAQGDDAGLVALASGLTSQGGRGPRRCTVH